MSLEIFVGIIVLDVLKRIILLKHSRISVGCLFLSVSDWLGKCFKILSLP